jgi:uncharacterized protein (UPF0303 family)
LKRSDFYRTLRKKRKVVDPIQKTNILMFEFNYNQAYKLWKYLNEQHKEDKLNLEIEIPESLIALRCFNNFSIVCFFISDFKILSNYAVRK